MKVLILNGSPHANGNTAIAVKELAKTFEAEGVEAEMDDSIPVLVSANVDPKSLANAFAASGDKTSTIPVGSSIGRGFSEWADHYVVLLRKNGKADVIPASKFNGASIMRGRNVNPPCVRYLDRGVKM